MRNWAGVLVFGLLTTMAIGCGEEPGAAKKGAPPTVPADGGPGGKGVKPPTETK